MKKANTHNPLSMTINAFTGAGFIFLTAVMPVSADENVTLHDKSISELSAGWWQWQEANYPDFNFGVDVVDCSKGQSGPVWYLGGTGGGSAERVCDAPIKGHKHLMFPLINANMYNPDGFCEAATGDPYCTVEEKRAILDGILSEDPAGIFNSTACVLQAEVDGAPAVYSAQIVRTQSPPHQYATDSESVADGIWVVLPPLPSGEHAIHFTGGICDVDTGGVLFSVDVTYILTAK